MVKIEIEDVTQLDQTATTRWFQPLISDALLK